MSRIRLGVWTPLPHTIRAEPAMERAIADLTTPGGPEGPDRSFDFAVEVVRRAERLGFVTTLIAERYLGPDLECWILASALAARTETIELMVAMHPGIVLPQVAAKMGASLDRISGGRFAANIVNGWWKEEFDLYGNGAWLDDPGRRYRRMEEFVRVMKGLWTEDTFTLDGDFYRVASGALPIKPKRRPWPPIYAASRTPAGKDIIARHCDVWFLPYEPTYRLYDDNFRGIVREIDTMNALARSHRRELRYGLSAHVIAAPSMADAEARADELEAYGKKDRVAAVAARALGAGLLGTPREIAGRIRRYEDAGVECLMLHFHPMLEGLETFAAEVLPLL
jgi:FMNH2-dependent dimethyl sulfone monooxygenase